ncbi:MAG: Sec-independent protein translocase subunit TatA [Actinomycetales bacterium]|nr:Sec-independent protein translocase subunit TatA [Actinomycetales bacterium]
MAFLREPTAWIVILVVILLFGAKRLPDVARGVGRSMRIFKAETEGLRTDGSTTPAEPPAVAATPAPAAPVAAPAAPRYLIDPVTGEQVLAQPVTPPADGAPRA